MIKNGNRITAGNDGQKNLRDRLDGFGPLARIGRYFFYFETIPRRSFAAKVELFQLWGVVL